MSYVSKYIGILSFCLGMFGFANEADSQTQGAWEKTMLYTWDREKGNTIMQLEALQFHIPGMMCCTKADIYTNGPRNIIPFTMLTQQKRIHAGMPQTVQCTTPKELDIALLRKQGEAEYKKYGFYDIYAGISSWYAIDYLPFFYWGNKVFVITKAQPVKTWTIQPEKPGFKLCACSLTANEQNQILITYTYQTLDNKPSRECLGLLDLNTLKITDVKENIFCLKWALAFALWIQPDYVMYVNRGRPFVAWHVIELSTGKIVAEGEDSYYEDATPYSKKPGHFFVKDGQLWAQSLDETEILHLYTPPKKAQ